ncbi:MAG: hypothetical protein IJK28_04595 [Clostridia bacterium]|nr:hypothetical protein [Clostridia bacterium]
MRKILIILAAVLIAACPACAAAETVESEESGMFVFADAIPEADRMVIKEKGTVERIAYPSRDYAGDGAEITKHAVVYLPFGYSADGEYDVLVLCHGVGGTEDEWSFGRTLSIGRTLTDNLIARGEVRPLIIVMPNGRSCANCYDTSMENAAAFYVFGQEIRNDLLPWMDSHYATWAAKHPDDPAVREHRAMAGLSMGGMQTINIGLCECLDLFAWFGAFSAAPTSYEASRIRAEIAKFPDLEIRYFYSICGLEDGLYFAGSGAAKNLPAVCDRFTEENWHWQERHGGHDFNIWNLGLYNFLRIYGGER